MKIYEVKHSKCRTKIGYMTENSRDSVLYCKKCHENYLIPQIFSLKGFSYIETKTLEIANIKEPEPEPTRLSCFESQSQSHLVSYAK